LTLQWLLGSASNRVKWFRADSQTYEDAVKFVKDGPAPTKTVPNDRKLKIYGLFKQVRR
jgi:hypothetical protein